MDKRNFSITEEYMISCMEDSAHDFIRKKERNLPKKGKA